MALIDNIQHGVHFLLSKLTGDLVKNGASVNLNGDWVKNGASQVKIFVAAAMCNKLLVS